MDINERHAHEHQKFRYFMVAAAGACLAYGLSRADATAGLTFSDFLWLASVIFWGASFVTGLFGIERINVATRINISMLDAAVVSGSQLLTSLNHLFNQNTDRARNYYDLQKWFLIWGAIFYGGAAIIIRFFESAPP